MSLMEIDFPPWPMTDPEVAAALAAAIADGSWGRYHGPHVPALEAALAAFHQVPRAITCASGTLAGEIALRAIGVQPGDEVILPAYDYEANFLNIHTIGARPVLADIHPANASAHIDALEQAWSPAVRAVCVSHLHGGLAAMGLLRVWADAKKLPLIEDAAQATGATVEGKPAGSWGDVGILSFGGSKLLTAGRGGALLIRDPAIAQRARVLLSRGVQQWAALSEMQACVLLPQLRQLPERTVHRHVQVQLLNDLIREVPGMTLFADNPPDSRAAYYKIGFNYDEAAFGMPREQFIKAMRTGGVAFDAGFRALHVGRSAGRYRAGGALAGAELAHRRVVMLHHPVLSRGPPAVELVAQAIMNTYRNRHR